MTSVDYITGVVQKLVRKYQTRDPYEICDGLGIRISFKDLGDDLKAYYFSQSRIRNIVINNRVPEELQRILVAHELGHERLHKGVALLKGFQEIELFDATIPTEYEANLFASELLIDDDELLALLGDDDKSFFSVAGELCLPTDFLDFKFRILKHKGYPIDMQYIANGKTLRGSMGEGFGGEE